MSIPYLNIHTHRGFTGEDILQVRSYFLQELGTSPNFPFTAGIHPWHAAGFSAEQTKGLLTHLSCQQNCVAIGEAGLDRKSRVDFKKQQEIFEIQLEYAAELGFPVIIHCVGAWNEILCYSQNTRIPFIFHGYRSNIEITRQLLRQNCYFSFGTYLMDNNPPQTIIQQIPVDRLFFETDESLLDIRLLYSRAAELLQITSSELKQQVFMNFNKLFKIRV